MTKSIIRPLPKFACASGVQGAHGAQSVRVLDVREDSSTGATKQSTAKVEFTERAIEQIQEIIDKNGLGASIRHENFLFIQVNHGHLTKLLKRLKEKESLRFTILTDLFATDFPDQLHRFEIVYNLLSLKNNMRLIIKTNACDGEAIPSVTKIFESADWYEREVFDLFGVVFNGHSNLKRILTDYGFSGHPLRKDFPVSGYVQVRYDNNLEKVINEPVKLQQAYREFDFVSPWQGSNYILPGDEKATKS